MILDSVARSRRALGAFFRRNLCAGNVCLALSAWGCDENACPDKSSPKDGTCTCADGTQLKASECDACEGAELQDFGELSDAKPDRDVNGTIISACERSFDFSLTTHATVTVKLSHAQAALTSSLEDPSGTALGGVSASKNQDGTKTFSLAAGSYHFVVHSADANESSFRLNLHATGYADELDPEPGSDQESAYPVGSAAELVTLPGYVGGADAQDYYSFQMEQNGTLTYAVTKVFGSVRAQVFSFAPIIDENAPSDYLDASTNMSATHELNLQKGRYFVRVIPNMADSLYELRLSSKPYAQQEEDPEPADDWTQALDIGKIGAKLRSNGGFVGLTDTGDFYRFELGENGTLTYSLRNVMGRVRAALYAEAAQIDPAKPLESIDAGPSDMTKPTLLEAGTYYLRVTCLDPRAPSLYTLALSAEGG